MIKPVILPLLISLLSYFSFGQLTPENNVQLRTELAQLVNNLRKEKGLKPLGFDESLKKAAEFHCKYMVKNQVLDHTEKKDIKNSTPEKRIVNSGGKDFEWTGENILYSTPQKFPLKPNEITVLAKEMFESWKNSPKHYANMIHKSYELGDFGFEVDLKKNIVYAAQVFGKKGYVVKNQLSTNAFGLTQGPADCANDMKGFMNLVSQLGNSIEIEGNDLMFYYSNFERFNQILKGNKDGIAVDIIQRDQVACSHPNELDFSKFYDGILLEPVYKPKLLSENRAQNEHRLVTKLGTIPAHLRGKELNVSLVLIRNGKACLYLSPGEIPSDHYHLASVSPTLINPVNTAFKYSGIIQSEEINYDFRSSDSIPVRYPNLNPTGKQVHSVYIQSFTSVDGSKLANDYYHYMRAQTIKRHIQSKLEVPENKITVEAKENWELMNFQMLYYFADSLSAMSKDSIKVHYKDYSEIPWRDLFQKQRRSSATINYFGKLPSNTSQKMLSELNLRTALINKDWNLANKAMYELYQIGKFPHFITEQPFFEIIKSQTELTQNASALFVMSNDVNSDVITQFLYAVINKSTNLSIGSKENLSLLYSKIAFDLLTIWDLPSQQLANVIHPKRIISMTENLTFRDEVMLNLHLTFINYYGQINDSKNISKSFDFISSFFDTKTLPLKEEIDLALFFNHWSMYDLTIKRLTPLFKANKLNEEGVFILAKTLSFYQKNSNESFLNEVMKKALLLNKTRWCKWINEEFQHLRDEKLKEMYCKSCSSY
jgi:uncharacterized protein YkwD